MRSDGRTGRGAIPRSSTTIPRLSTIKNRSGQERRSPRAGSLEGREDRSVDSYWRRCGRPRMLVTPSRTRSETERSSGLLTEAPMKLDTALYQLRSDPLRFLSSNLLSIAGHSQSSSRLYHSRHYDNIANTPTTTDAYKSA